MIAINIINIYNNIYIYKEIFTLEKSNMKI